MINSQGNSEDQYKVIFNPNSAWSLVYEDYAGKINFVFEPGSEEKKVFLNPTVILNNELVTINESHDNRAIVGFERTKKYLKECGYIIENN